MAIWGWIVRNRYHANWIQVGWLALKQKLKCLLSLPTWRTRFGKGVREEDVLLIRTALLLPFLPLAMIHAKQNNQVTNGRSALSHFFLKTHLPVQDPCGTLGGFEGNPLAARPSQPYCKRESALLLITSFCNPGPQNQCFYCCSLATDQKGHMTLWPHSTQQH